MNLKNLEKNITVATKVAAKLDTSVASTAHDFLVVIYKKFPILAYSIGTITYGQILVALLLSLFIIFLRPLLVKLIVNGALRLTVKTATKYDDKIIKNLKRPLNLAFLIFAIYIFFSVLLINNKIISLILSSMLIFDFFWIIWAIIDGLHGLIYKSVSKLTPNLSSSLGGFVMRIIKIIVWVSAISSILSLWGINVTALFASLGLGGLAFALAAKDTAANLFGSIAILMDKSIKVGDWIKVDKIEGIVEDVGMRTTKIRTFHKSLIAVPNQIIANNPIENFSRRSIRRIKMTIGLTYNTTNTQVETIIQEIKNMLKNHPRIVQNETMLVNFNNFGDSAKEIFIYTFTDTAIWQEYLKIREDIQYKIEDIVLKNGSGFAFPSHSLYIENLSKDIAK